LDFVKEAGSIQTQTVSFRCPCHGAEFDIRGKGIGNGNGLPNWDAFVPIVVKNIVYFDILSPKKDGVSILETRVKE
jgi:hypothetical protein